MNRIELTVFVLLLLIPALNAEAITIMPMTSATIRDADGNGSPDLLVAGVYAQAGQAFGFEDRGVLEFSLAGLGSPLTTATLNFTLRAWNVVVPTSVEAYAYAGDGTVTMADFSATGAFVGSSTVPTSGLYPFSYDVVSSVNSILGSAGNVLTVRFQVPFSLTSAGEILDSTLSVSGAAVPEPTSLLLLASGMAGVAGWKRRLARRSQERRLEL